MVARSSRVITVDDYLELPDDGIRYELFEGEIHQMAPSPNTTHQRVVRNLLFLLEGHVRHARLGELFVAPFDVVLSDLTVLQPDLLFVSERRREIILPRHVRGAPDLVIEVVSPSSIQRDQVVKAQLYARFGVPHYWLFDPHERTALAYALAAGDYRQTTAADRDGSFAAPPFADLSIPLEQIWA
jgi:Uma2 family endonuclease